jgi:hypothetical protein
MSDALYNRRQKKACERLRKAGILEKARRWLRKNRPPKSWKGTPLEWAEEEMPVLVSGWESWFLFR